MSISILIHLFIIIIFIPLGIRVYKKYESTSGFFFLLFSLLLSMWFFLYIIVFSISIEPSVILIINRVMYAFSLIGMYSMCLFIGFFKLNKIHYKKIHYFIYLILFSLFSLSVFTPYVLESVNFIEAKGRYIENYGSLYWIFAGLYMLFIPLFLLVSFLKIRTLHTINRLRLIYLSTGFFIYIFLSIVFLVILPLMGKNLLDNNVVFLIIPFFIFTILSIRGYNFINVKILFSQVLAFVSSVIFSIFFIFLIKNYYSQLGVWGIQEGLHLLDLIIGIVLFFILHHIFVKLICSNTNVLQFTTNINRIKKQISLTTNIHDLNSMLEKGFKNDLKIKFAQVIYFPEPANNSALYQFFIKDLQFHYFINDIVFIEENKSKFNINQISDSIPSQSLLNLPLYNNHNLPIAFLSIGQKTFKDYYYADEIKILQDFSDFIGTHLRYIKTFHKLHELSINLDQKVDEQTIGYNQLINKQKEFIGYISHEVKGPISSSIFQIDSIIEEVVDEELSEKELLIELNVLNDLLIKTGELVNKLFSVQQFELTSKSLFKEKIQLITLLKHEISLFQKVNTGIKFSYDLDESIKYIQLDKVQFKQVIDNLINNAIKVISHTTGEIFISAKIKKGMIRIAIEDNGIGFTDLDIKKIFDKYSTGQGSSVGLGMGLYLCKTIVELHGGDIQAALGKRLGGAKIIINIPHI